MNKPKISVIVIYNSKENLENSLKSITAQTFSNIEIICVNNAAKDNAFEIAQAFEKQDKRIKLINLPAENDTEYAKRAGLGLADTDYVCFIDGNTILTPDYLKDLYLDLSTKQEIKIETGKLYKRNYLENSSEVNAIISQRIEEKIKEEIDRQSILLKEQKEELKKEWDKFYQINAENVKNSAYDLQCRFEQLENNFFDKDAHLNDRINGALDWHDQRFDEKIHKIYEEISNIYDYINSEMNKKGVEINNVYEAISKNYQYTEEVANNKEKYVNERIDAIEEPVWQKLSEFEKELTIRYVNLKRLMDVQLDEFKVQLGAVTGNTKDIETVIGNTMNESIEGLYGNINKLSSTFYEEISKLYSDLNERINKDKEDLRYRNEQKIEELREEFNSKLDSYNKES